ncbi:uncharacterized protein EV420DRAFT_1743492 [Desarmillaria tabescens]|uniref:F-box domain-containing protein n=1 Tax=Armillaria tabescens TaxID=1929756 RepID=A0AA39NJU9_ARMTA|nr:uncharacterized protein EV420DRAFT_1743492 [Desarmillaria tabescens]KAK0466922.1 hypothetical protein EV420DRAFT_1743492 [Desarmillaria tabescens]
MAAVPQESLAPHRLEDKYIYSPSFICLLQTNDPPDADTDATRAISDTIAQAAEDTVLAEKEIATLQTKIKEKQAKIRALRRVIDDCNTVLSPIRRLPTDIVFEIFQSVVQDKYDVFDVTSGPWLLTHICKPWRTLACEYGALWSCVNVTNVMAYGETRPINEPVMLLRTALKRSGSFPLSVWFEYRTKKKWRQYEESEINLPGSLDSDNGELSDDDDENSILSTESGYEIVHSSFASLPIDCQLVKVLMQHSRQFQHLNIEVPSPPALKCLRVIHGRLDSLETVHISLPYEAWVHNELQETFALAPKLRVARLNRLSLDSVLDLPLSLLKSLDHQLEDMRAEVWLSTVQTILQKGSQLTEYAPPSPRKAYNSKMPRFRSSTIRTFHVRAWYVLDYFQLPGLDELHICHFGFARDPHGGDTLSAFIHRSGCALKKLCLRGVPDSIISAFPFVHKSLVDLDITITHSNDRLLSDLKHLHAYGWSLPAFIKTRDKMCGLKSGSSLPTSDPIRRLLNEGLDIAILVGRKSKPWEDTMGREEGDEIVDVRDLFEEEDGYDWDSEDDDDDFEDDNSWSEESDAC